MEVKGSFIKKYPILTLILTPAPAGREKLKIRIKLRMRPGGSGSAATTPTVARAGSATGSTSRPWGTLNCLCGTKADRTTL